MHTRGARRDGARQPREEELTGGRGGGGCGGTRVLHLSSFESALFALVAFFSATRFCLTLSPSAVPPFPFRVGNSPVARNKPPLP